MQSVPQMALKGHLGEQAARQVAPEGSKRCPRAKPTQIPQQEVASRADKYQEPGLWRFLLHTTSVLGERPINIGGMCSHAKSRRRKTICILAKSF